MTKIARIQLPEPHPAQEIFTDWETTNPEARVLVAPAGTKVGKALHVETPIPTPSGWVRMGDIRAGDFVFDEHGKPVKVIYATEWKHHRVCYEVEFSDGSKIIADAEHLWKTTTHFVAVRTTDEIRSTIDQRHFVDWRYIVAVRSVPSVPVCCIRVDSLTHMFLAGKSYIPTHNSFGCSLWEITAQLVNPGLYGVWIAPTLYKCRVGYRYMKAMLPDIPGIKCRDSSLEINLANHSFIKFMHGRDAEVTVEGDAIDTFVIDESGKQREQLWHSLFTTITQTDGRGIITGTPRGRNWYYHLYTKAIAGDPMLCHAKLRTIDSPYVKQAAVDRAKRILPPLLYSQYYLADFVSDSSVYGALDGVWRDELPVLRPGFWLHPDAELRRQTVVMGVDLAKRQDYTVIIAITGKGETVGFLRMRRKTYQEQAQILAKFASYFGGDDNEIRYDRTGVGDAVGEEISRIFDKHPGDWTITPVIFTNASKQEMVARVTWAIEAGFWRCPRIPRLEHEMINLEVSTSKSGLATYSAPPGDHDDCHWSLALALSGVHSSNAIGRSVDMIEAAMSGQLLTESDDEDDLGDDDTDLDDTLDDLDDDFLDDIREMM